ncbi:Transcription factor [Phytophthora cinnamomi]|uniref:Transcription factor n=1 Tax=Phytophthora cinnamomi TaxID=4785 RepID=UPI0035597729|nr:Transcription factor [Phytophthora cinnamomi]
MQMSDDACRVCGKEDDEEFLVLCDGCDRAFHTGCAQGCTCCNTKPRNFSRKPAVPEGDWFCKFCAGRVPKLEEGKPPVSSIFAWGDNEDGQLALPDTEDKVVWKPTKVHELDGIGVLDIACGETCTYALCNDTNLYSVGTGVYGQLGHQDIVHEKLVHFRMMESVTEDKRSKGEGRFSQILSGAGFGVVITTEGHAYTWGNGEVGQLGHQENKNKKVPKKISALRELEVPVDLAACGSDFVLMTTKDNGDDDQFNTQNPGVFMSMGSNNQAQLGDASNKNQWVPQLLNNDSSDLTSTENTTIEDPSEFLLGRDITQLAAGRSHSIAVVAGTKGLWAWGYGDRGQIGHPKPAPPAGQSKFFRSQFRVPRPRFVQAFKNDAVKFVACGGQHTLVLLQDGRLFAMGDNEFGQLGVKRGETPEENCVDVPVHVAVFGSDKTIKQIGCGDEFSMALTATGEVYSWGRGQLGQLGLGESQSDPLDVPTKVPDLPAIQKLAVGINQVFAIEFTNVTLPPPVVRAVAPKRGRKAGPGAKAKKARK